MHFLINQKQILSLLIEPLDWKLLGGCDPSGPLGALYIVVPHSYCGDAGGQIHSSSTFNLEEMEEHTLMLFS